MIGFKIDKSLFFDRAKAVNATDRASRRVLSRFGAFVRQRAKSSIRPARKRPRESRGSSDPGQPPRSHTGLLKRFIFFGYDPRPRKQSVVIGPAPLPSTRGKASELLEYGGTAILRDRRSGRRRRARYQARPFMGPAFAAEQPKLPQMWRDSIHPRK